MRASLDSSLLLIFANALTAKAQAQSCPDIHIFGARETSVAPGFGSAGALAIDYPACGGQASCGGVEYGASAKQGTEAVTTAVNGLNKRCPNTKIVMIGYSQGGQIMDNNISSAVEQVKAVIMMGDPRFIHGLAYGVGTCDAGGFDARPEGFVCPNADKVQIYCDAQDPFCCNGNDAAHHQQYVSIYGKEALKFVNSKLSGAAAGGNTGSATDGGAGSSGDANGDAGNNGGNAGNAGGNTGNAGITETRVETLGVTLRMLATHNQMATSAKNRQ
ncbi:hypothetical protein NXS19_004516 [Fusarium pseudograminearum]|nr:hypothetical protein NXS19_004516 [Fusarium pseudograminearum]